MGISRLVSVFVSVGALTARACDLCGCYTPQLETMPSMQAHDTGWYAAVAEQFTHFGTLQFEGKEVPDSVGQYLNSSITQLIGGYNFGSRFALQLNVPLIYREFKRPDGFRIEHGTESGLGDISLLLNAVAFKYSSGARREFQTSGKNPVASEHEPDFTFSAVVFAGLKVPTGATSRLKEEFMEMEVPGAPESGIHGHDLTLGTGSYDGIFAEQNSLRWKNFFMETNVQFTLRGDGAHQMHMANDLTWSGGPGYYVVRKRDVVFGVECNVSGEHKGKDRFMGMAMDDTGITSLFVGPRFVASLGRWSAELNVDLPVLTDNTALQVVPDYRLRGGIAYHF